MTTLSVCCMIISSNEGGTPHETDNRYDSNAIQIVVHIRPIHKRTVVGYVPRALAEGLAKVIDMGIQVKASLMGIIGGYSYKETLGVLIDIAI